MEAKDIFITIATDRPEEPYQRVNLQAFADVVAGTLMDLKSEIHNWAELTNEMSKSVLHLQETFNKLTGELHGAAAMAKTIAQVPKPKSGGMN